MLIGAAAAGKQQVTAVSGVQTQAKVLTARQATSQGVMVTQLAGHTLAKSGTSYECIQLSSLCHFICPHPAINLLCPGACDHFFGLCIRNCIAEKYTKTEKQTLK